MLSTEKHQDFLEVRKDQHSVREHLIIGYLHWTVRNKCNSLVCSETEGWFSFPFTDIFLSVSTTCPYIFIFFPPLSFSLSLYSLIINGRVLLIKSTLKAV